MKEQDKLLLNILEMAVPLWVLEYKNKNISSKETQDEIKEIVSFLGEHGDALFFKQKDLTKDAFNKLAKGIAILSFAPGGVDLFGKHWDSSRVIIKRKSRLNINSMRKLIKIKCVEFKL